MATGPVFIPDKTPDLRSCSRTRWGNGVDILSSTLKSMLGANCPDGDSGSYVATSESTGTNAWVVRLHHVNGSGQANGVATVSSASGVWYFSVQVVPSDNQTCIVIWTHPTYQSQLLAQRFDRACSPLWSAPVQLAAPAGGFHSLDAKSDGSGGAVVAFNRPGLNGVNRSDLRVQRVNVAGVLQFGANGTQVTGSVTNVADYPVGLAVGGGSIGLAWQTFAGNAPLPVSACWLDMAGQVTTAPFVIGTVLETWGDLAVRRVVADSAGGLYVGMSTFNAPLKVLRLDANATVPIWTHTGPILASVDAYALASDGDGGVLIACVNATGTVSLQRRTKAGIGVYSNSAASAIASISTSNRPAMPPWAWARVLTVASRGQGGALLAFQDGSAGTERLMAWCCDANGSGVASPQAIGGGAGAQGMALMHGSDNDSVNLAWLGDSGSQGSLVAAQKLGCCPPGVPNGRFVERFPHIKCAIPFDFPKQLPGGFQVLLTCGGKNWRGGLLPIPFLYGAPGIGLPGALGTHGVPAPDWVRLSLRGVPEYVRLELRSHKNTRVAVGEVVSGPDRSAPALRLLDFKPKANLSYVLIFVATGKALETVQFQVGMEVAFGDGKMPPFLPTQPPAFKAGKKSRDGK